jgi:hypothetical protein
MRTEAGPGEDSPLTNLTSSWPLFRRITSQRTVTHKLRGHTVAFCFADPDLYGSALILVSRIRIWIQEGKNYLQKNRKK